MGTEGIQDKYVNPYTDFGFKLLFKCALVQGGSNQGCNLP